MTPAAQRAEEEQQHQQRHQGAADPGAGHAPAAAADPVLGNAAELDPRRVRHPVGGGHGEEQESFGVPARPEELGRGLSGGRARPGVGQGSFQTVTRMDAHPPFLDREDDERAVVLALASELPGFRVALDETEEVLPVGGGNGQHLDLGRGLPLQLAQPALHSALGGGLDEACGIHHVGAGVLDGDRPVRRAGKTQEQGEPRQGATTHRYGSSGRPRRSRGS